MSRAIAKRLDPSLSLSDSLQNQSCLLVKPILAHFLRLGPGLVNLTQMETDKVVIPHLTVKTLSDRSLLVDLPSEVKNMGDLKAALVAKHGIERPIQQQVIIAKGRVLADSEPVPAPDSTLYLFYYEPAALLADPIESAKDWDTKNRIKVFKGLYLVSIRKFAQATPLLIDTLTTFSEPGFIPFKDCVKYAIISGMLTLDRPDILQKLIKSPEVLEVIHDIPDFESYTKSLYNCRYQEFFETLCT